MPTEEMAERMAAEERAIRERGIYVIVENTPWEVQ